MLSFDKLRNQKKNFPRLTGAKFEAEAENAGGRGSVIHDLLLILREFSVFGGAF